MGRTVEMVVSLNEAKALEAARGGKRCNIEKLIETVPGATVISGDPEYALRIQLERRYVRELRRRVSDFCVVDDYQEFEVQG